MILNKLVTHDEVILGEIFRDVKFAEFHERSRTLFEKNQIFDFEVVISKIKI